MKTLGKTETITDLTKDLVDVKNQLINGTVDMKTACEINNTAGKILGTMKVRLAYLALSLAFSARGESVPAIAYLGDQKCLTG